MTVSSRILTVPNLISFARLGLVPVFLVLVLLAQDGAALLVLVVASVSDFIDGIIARRFGQVSRLGQLLDPAADRLFIFAALIGLGARGVVPWWLAAVIVGRDIMLLVVGVVLANRGFGPLPVHHLGKVATFCLFYALPLVMLGHAFETVSPIVTPLAWAFALWGTFLYWWAGLLYARQARAVIAALGIERSSQSDTLGG